jgi:predicted component of type VI protein secretion system
MPAAGHPFFWGTKPMNMRVFAIAGAAAISLAGCNSSNQDAVNNAELNQPAADQLNDQASEAANDAANSEAAALGNQQQQLEQENAAAQANSANPSDAQEQNVSGM